jgi:hypothetical protein
MDAGARKLAATSERLECWKSMLADFHLPCKSAVVGRLSSPPRARGHGGADAQEAVEVAVWSGSGDCRGRGL